MWWDWTNVTQHEQQHLRNGGFAVLLGGSAGDSQKKKLYHLGFARHQKGLILDDWDLMGFNGIYHLVMTNIADIAMERSSMLSIGKPSISVGHLYHGKLLKNHMV